LFFFYFYKKNYTNKGEPLLQGEKMGGTDTNRNNPARPSEAETS
jgi:hypothetical protein